MPANEVMATITLIEDLEIWQDARSLCKLIYPITFRQQFQNDPRICNQIRGSIGSIMDNIAEGFERAGRKEFIHFLSISRGEAGELKSQVYRCLDIGYITNDEFVHLVNLIQMLIRRISKFIQYLNGVEVKGMKFRTK